VLTGKRGWHAKRIVPNVIVRGRRARRVPVGKKLGQFPSMLCPEKIRRWYELGKGMQTWIPSDVKR